MRAGATPQSHGEIRTIEPFAAPRRADTARGTMILGVPVDDVTMDEAVDRVFELVDDGRTSGRTHQVATVNVDFVVNAVGDPTLRSLMQRTSLSIPDGMPIVWGSRLLGSPLRTRVAGADLVPALVERAAARGGTVALYGAAPGVADRAAAILRERYPAATVVADAGPKFGEVDELTLDDLQPLIDARPDVCCVAFGNPKQERFIASFGPKLGIPVMIGVGGTLDFIVGEKRRAPAWMQRTGLEWLHRAATEPGRLARRYLRDATVFVPRLARHAWLGRRSHRAGDVSFARSDGGDVVVDLTMLRAADNRIAADIATAVRVTWVRGGKVQVVGSRGSDSAFRRVPGLAEMLATAVA